MFVELLARSSFSFLSGSSHPEELVKQAHTLGLSGLALCDRDGLYGSVRAHVAARELGQRLVVGAELSIGTGPRPRKLTPKEGEALEFPSLALLVENHVGYSNLCQLLTRSHAELPKGESRLELAWLSEYSKGLLALFPAPRRPGDPTTAPWEWLRQVREVFGDRAALALHRHQDGLDRDREALVRNWSKEFALPIVASARAFYHERARKPLLDVMHCIRTHTVLDRCGTELGANARAHLRSEQAMLNLFRDVPEWVHRAAEIADDLRFSLSELRYDFPCSLAPGENADDKLRGLAEAGLLRRYPAGAPEGVRMQMERELQLIRVLDVAPYFLTTWEIVEIARSLRILCQGRGSAANSIVCYALGITAVDPARSNLLFERFLSAERREPPDIDIDFEHERREEVIQEIYRRYGRESAAMVSEVICYRGRSALREVGKVFGLSLEQVDRLSTTLGHWDDASASTERLVQRPGSSLRVVERQGQREPGTRGWSEVLAEAGFDGRDARLGQVVEFARQLQGFPRHLSIHVGGFVLSAKPLYLVAPVEPARMVDRSVIPWDKDDLDALGFFKVDVLGLGMLTAIRKALATIHESGGLQTTPPETRFDPLEVVTRIPAEDPAVYELICRADTVGVFQIESRAQMAMLPRLRPKCFYDLVIEVAIVRPGPIQGGMVHPYLRRRNAEEPVSVPHPKLSAILERTLGVPLFQEQVMQIAIEGAGYSAGEADQLRRDMAAWKRNGKLLGHRERLLVGFAKQGIDREFGEALFEQIKGFGDYGFPESHAASFALLVYASAWLKARYPADFAAALLNAQPMGFYAPHTILSDARRHGVEVRDVDITRSDWDSTLEPSGPSSDRHRPKTSRKEPSPFTLEDSLGSVNTTPGSLRSLRIGFRLIKGLGEASARRIEKARSEWPFSDIEDLRGRAELRRDELEALAEAGALEALLSGRRSALWATRTPRLLGLFAGKRIQEPVPELAELSAAETLLFDYRRKNLSTDDHPMRHLRSRLQARGVLTALELTRVPQRRRVKVAGVVICRQRPATASGVVFVTLEDETGFSNLVLWKRVFEEYRFVASRAVILFAEGKVERQTPGKTGMGERDVVHLIVDRLERLDLPGRGIGKLSRDFH